MQEQINPSDSKLRPAKHTWQIMVTIIVTAIIVGGGVYMWQRGGIEPEEQEADQEIAYEDAELGEEIVPAVLEPETSATPDIQLDPLTFVNTAVLPRCDMQPHTITPAVIEQIGLGRFLENGYRVEDLCYQEEGQRAGVILVKEEKNLFIDGTAACMNDCDRVAFGTIDFANRKRIVTLSGYRLGLYGEMHAGQYCRIERVVPANSLFSDQLLFQCGSAEGGDGYTTLYRLQFIDDKLIKEEYRALGGDPKPCLGPEECYVGYECRFEQAFGGKVCMP